MNNKKIAIFYGGKLSKHLCLLRKAARDMKVQVDLISYNKVSFDTNCLENTSFGDYNVIFFRTTGKHWEEVNFVVDWVKKNNPKCKIVDPLVEKGRPMDACKAWQMVELTKNNIEVPRTIYGSLWTLFSCMNFFRDNSSFSSKFFIAGECMRSMQQKTSTSKDFCLNFPVILKGSSGDRGTNVFKINNIKQLEAKVRELRKIEIEGGKRYMLQEFIPNDGD
jgi:hypothetical protein